MVLAELEACKNALEDEVETGVPANDHWDDRVNDSERRNLSQKGNTSE